MIIKLLIGFTGFGLTISTWVSSVLYLNKNSTVALFIEKNEKNKEILNSKNFGDGSDWNLTWKNYREDNSISLNVMGNDKWNLGNWDNKENAPLSLAKACEKKIKETIKDEKDNKYTNFLRWCSK